MFIPTNEQGVVMLFGMLAKENGWEVVSIRSDYPDAILRDKDGDKWIAEFEFLASNFLLHRHDHRECDMIICWENDYLDCPLPIIELKAGSLKSPAKATDAQKAIEYWMRRCLRAERALNSADGDTEDQQSESVSRMILTEKRLNTIRNTLLDRGWPGVSEMARIVGAGRTTIYRDLDSLEAEGVIAINRGDDGKITDVIMLPVITSLPAFAPVQTNGNH